jgi:hypothetical protein
LRQTFFAGQPMLMSMICAPRANVITGSIGHQAPVHCQQSVSERGSISRSCCARCWLLRESRSRGSEWTISPTNSPVPKRAHSRRNGRSVTPAIGARATALRLRAKGTDVQHGVVRYQAQEGRCGGRAMLREHGAAKKTVRAKNAQKVSDFSQAVHRVGRPTRLFGHARSERAWGHSWR